MFWFGKENIFGNNAVFRWKKIRFKAERMLPQINFSLQRKSHYNYRDDFALEKFEKVKILVYHICPKNG